MKIAILGYSGSGKSTLAKQLAAQYQLPLLHLDQVQFLANWQERDQTESKQLVREHLKQADWVIDGNYSDFYQEERLAAADQIILLLFPRWTCLKRVFRRYLTYRHTTRPDMAENCPEKLNLPFIWWILHEGRTKQKQAAYAKIQGKYPSKIVIIKNQKELADFYHRQCKQPAIGRLFKNKGYKGESN